MLRVANENARWQSPLPPLTTGLGSLPADKREFGRVVYARRVNFTGTSYMPTKKTNSKIRILRYKISKLARYVVVCSGPKIFNNYLVIVRTGV